MTETAFEMNGILLWILILLVLLLVILLFQQAHRIFIVPHVLPVSGKLTVH